jgi:hypothetical protein
VYELDGVMYYSPNSTMNVAVPEKWSDTHLNAFRRTRVVLRDFQGPLWFDRHYRCAPFIPLTPFFDDLMCAPLRRRLETEEDFEMDGSGLWSVPSKVVQEWLQIEKQTQRLITRLEAYRRPYQRSIRPPSDMGLQRKFKTIRHAAFFVRRSKEWFLLLFAYATWFLSEHHIFSNPNRETSSLWIHLVEHVDVNFLRCFVSSTIICISSQIPRVGCFFDVEEHANATSPAKTAEQLHRFVYNSIPIWIPLTSATWEILDSPDLIKFRPSKSLMRAFEAQRVGDSIGRAPLYKSRDGVESWRRMVVTEVDRPTSNGRDVTREELGEAIEMGGLGFYEEGESDVGNERPDDPPSVLGLDPGLYSLPEVVVEDSPLSPPPTPYRELDPEHVQHLPWTMALRVPMLWGLYLEDVPAGLPPLSAGHLNLLYRALGEETQPRPLPDIPINRLLYYFFMSIRFIEIDGFDSIASVPNSDLLPLSVGLRAIIETCVTRIEEEVYVIELPTALPCPKIVVYCAEAAVLCCRVVDGGFEAMVVTLFRHGVRFNVCVESSVSPPPPPSEFVFPMVPPVVPADKDVDKNTYDDFVQLRRLYLVGHRRRAALLQGGLVGRIAREVIGSDRECERLILTDASPCLFESSNNMVVEWGDGTYLYDDVLPDYELDYILGVHFHRKGSFVAHTHMWSISISADLLLFC